MHTVSAGRQGPISVESRIEDRVPNQTTDTIEEESPEPSSPLIRKVRSTSTDKNKLQSLSDGIKAISTVITSFFMFATIAMLVLFSFLEFHSDAIVIEPLLLPKKLEELGYTSQVVTRHFRDAVWQVAVSRKSGHFDSINRPFYRKKRIDTTAASKPDDLTIPGIGLSLQTAVRVIKDYLQIPQNRAGGEILIVNGHLNFRPRYEKRITNPPHPAAEVGPQHRVTTEELDVLLSEGARKVMVAYSNKKHQREIDWEASPAKLKGKKLIEWGNTLYTYRDYRGAIDKYEQAASEVESHIAYTNWGEALAKEGNYAGSKEKFEHAVDIAIKNDPKNEHKYHNKLGVALIRLGDYDDAIKTFKRVLEQAPGYAKAKCNWGWVLAKRDKYERAIERYRQCLEVEPENHKTYDSLGNALRQWGDELGRQKKKKEAHKRYTEAFKNYENALRVTPNYVAAYINWGLTLSQAGNFSAASSKYQKALAINPRNAKAYNNWSVVLRKQGRYDDAIDKARRAIDINPGLAAAYSTWGEALISKKEHEAAIAKFERAADLDDKKVAYYDWGQALEALEKPCGQIVDKYKAAVGKNDEYSAFAKDALAHVGSTCNAAT